MKVSDGTGEVSSGHRPTTGVIGGISLKAKSAEMPGENSDEVIVPVMIRTTQPVLWEGPLL